jgi:hypothetical protein
MNMHEVFLAEPKPEPQAAQVMMTPEEQMMMEQQQQQQMMMEQQGMLQDPQMMEGEQQPQIGEPGSQPYSNEQNDVPPDQMGQGGPLDTEGLKMASSVPKGVETALELGGLATLGIPSAYHLIHGDPKPGDENSAFHRLMQNPNTAHVAEVGGLSALAAPYIWDLGKDISNKLRRVRL